MCRRRERGAPYATMGEILGIRSSEIRSLEYEDFEEGRREEGRLKIEKEQGHSRWEARQSKAKKCNAMQHKKIRPLLKYLLLEMRASMLTSNESSSKRYNHFIPYGVPHFAVDLQF